MTLCKAFVAWMMAPFGGPELGGMDHARVEHVETMQRMQQTETGERFGGQPVKGGRNGAGHGRHNFWGSNGFWRDIFNGI